MRKFVLFCCLIAASFFTTVNAQDYLWGKLFEVGGSGNGGIKTATLSDGGYYYVQKFTTFIAFGTDTVWTDSPNTILLARFNADGVKVWSKKFICTSNVTVNTITVDAKDNAIIGGGFLGTLTLDRLSLISPITNRSSAYLLKVDPIDGSFIWAVPLINQESNFIYDAKTTADGSIYVVGQQIGNARIAMYNEYGILQWEAFTTRIYSATGCRFDRLDISPEGDLYIIGHFVGTIRFGNTNITAWRTIALGDIVLVKFKREGMVNNWKWVKQISSPNGPEGWDAKYNSAHGVLATPNGPIVLGRMEGDLIFEDGIVSAPTSDWGYTYFLAGFDANGNKRWVSHSPTTKTSFISKIAIGSDNNLYATGEFGFGDFLAGDSTFVNSNDQWTFQGILFKMNASNGIIKEGWNIKKDAFNTTADASFSDFQLDKKGNLLLLGWARPRHEGYQMRLYLGKIQLTHTKPMRFFAKVNNSSGLELLNPAGGEELFGGDSLTLHWKSQTGNNVKVEYTTDGWLTKHFLGIYPTSAGNGVLNTFVPYLKTNNYHIRITDVFNPDISTQNLVPMSIRISELKLTEPNGGEKYIGGDILKIKWTAKNVNNIRLAYSIDKGNTWTMLDGIFPAAAGIDGVAWQVPNIKRECLFRIMNAEDSLTYDYSDSPFFITYYEITLNTPNGGEKLVAGHPYVISWTTNKADAYKAFYSTEDGRAGTWKPIFANPNSTNTLFVWTVPNDTSTRARVRISRYYGPELDDISDTTFSILPPRVRVTSPNGGEIFGPTGSSWIEWSDPRASSTSRYKVEFRYSDYSAWETVVESTSSLYAILTPRVWGSAYCRIRVSKIGEHGNEDISDDYFTCVGTDGDVATASKSVLKIYPNPTTSYLTMEADGIESGKAHLRVFDINSPHQPVIFIKDIDVVRGRFVYHLAVNELKAGFYFVEIRSGKEKRTAKFEKQ
jgi:hypothetical protein